jgi:hypothetical protein
MADVRYPWVDKAIPTAVLNLTSCWDNLGSMVFEIFSNTHLVQGTLIKILNQVTLNEKLLLVLMTIYKE